MKTYFDCMACFVRQAIDAARLATDDQTVQDRIIRSAIREVAELDATNPPPVMAIKIHRIIRQITGLRDPYAEIKRQYNDIAMKLMPDMRKIIEDSPDPPDTALKLSIAGNIIDFGVSSSLEPGQLDETIRHALEAELDGGVAAKFREEILTAESILYILDNAGEIVFDRLFIEQLPTRRITAAVRGMPIINDATIEDAEEVGLTDIVPVIDTGLDAPGVVLEESSDDFVRAFESADLIISKGQGNYETLSDAEANIYFILKVKCPAVAGHLDAKIGDCVFVNPMQDNLFTEVSC